MNYDDPRIEKFKNMTLTEMFDSIFDSRKKEREEAIRKCAELEEENRKLRAVVEAAKPAAKALRFWLVESDLMCECEGETHICGYTERLNELKALEQALAALDGGGGSRRLSS